MTRVRIEIGDRVVEVNASTREEALKAFKFAARGQFAAADVEQGTRLRWRTGQFGEYRQLVDAAGNRVDSKIPAIKALRNATGIGLGDAKNAIESGELTAPTRELAARLRKELAPYVSFVDA